MARKVKLDLAVKVPRGEVDKVMKYAKKYNRDNLQLVMRVIADDMLEQAKRSWPIDTGRSAKGLRVQVETKGYTVVFRNRMDYAYWVEKRWFPLYPFFRTKWPGIMKRAKGYLRRGDF